MRYSGYSRRIIQSCTSNWYFLHQWNQRSCSMGVCESMSSCNANNVYNWNVGCWRNTPPKPPRSCITVDNASTCSTCASGNVLPSNSLCINKNNGVNPDSDSDWQLHSFYVWDNHLNNSAFKSITNDLWSSILPSPCPQGQTIITLHVTNNTCPSCTWPAAAIKR